MKINTRKVYEGKLTDHFALHEFACKSNGEILISGEFFKFVEALEEFRIWYNRPIVVESGFRTPEYNASLPNSSSVSQHLNGIAVDIHFPSSEMPMNSDRKTQFLNNCEKKWFELCDKYNVNGGFGKYNWGFHIDFRNDRPRARWDYR